MSCLCGEKAVYHRRYSGQHFCRDCFNRYFEKKTIDTIRKYNMISPHDKVGVGLSGGKDSTALVHVLYKYRSMLHITLHPIIIDEGIENYRKEGINTAQNTCDTLGLIPMILSFKDETGETLDTLQMEGSQKPCTYCGVLRRKLLNRTASQQGLDKLATGHNLDDEAQAIMMNYLTGDIVRLNRLKGKATSENLIKRIKPFSRLPEKEIMLYTHLNEHIVHHTECPYTNENHRTKIRSFINSLEKDRPGTKHSIIKGWEKITNPNHKNPPKIKSCDQCQEPTTRIICRSCELTQEIKIKRKGVTKDVAD